jgi:hypothetical protein
MIPALRGPSILCVALLATFASTLMGGTSNALADSGACRAAVSRDMTERLYALLNHPPTETDCTFDGVTTDRNVLAARWSHGGVALAPIRVVPRECAPDAAGHDGPFVIDVPDEITKNCPSVAPLIAGFAKQVATETPTIGRENGSPQSPLFRGARALLVGVMLVAAALLLRGATRLRQIGATWIVLAVAAFSVALVIRAALPFSIGNWYSEVMPAIGPPPSMRFGPAFVSLQSMLRDVGLWNPRALVVSQVLIGALALPLLLGVLRELRLDIAATTAALVLLIFAPFHARLSATSSEHVLGSTLCLGLLLSWLRATRTGGSLWFGLAALLFPAVCATRVDMAAQASMVLVWPLLRDRAERDGCLRGRSLVWRTAALVIVAAATLAVAYQLIVQPSNHPMAQWSDRVVAFGEAIPQLWRMATNDPPWLSLSSVLLAIPGTVAMAVRRPRLLVRIFATLLFAFAALGRTFAHDELVGARYFLFLIPVFLMLSGYGFEALLAWVPQRRRAITAVAGMFGLALWTAAASRPAYAARYAFQDEYSFAQRALSQLPAGCVVFEVPVRTKALPHDVDCCLDVARSPLVLDFPALQFRNLPENLSSVFAAASPCVAYYESVACEIPPAPPGSRGSERTNGVVEYFQAACSAVRQHGRLELLAQTTTSPRTTNHFFDATRPHAALYRWSP